MNVKKIGRYEIVGELGRGAMGIVYKASDPTIGRLVALKVLPLAAQTEKGAPTSQEVFMREVRAAGRLTHSAIVTIHDAFEDPESHSGCIVMEYVEGRTLEKILMLEPALPIGQALDIAHQAAEALHYAHQHQVIHRDLKPANLLLSADGRIKITDFGIAKITGREGAMRTVGVVGTPSYMSPEQVTGGEIDARSDLFSLGIIQYLMLTGKKPFGGDTAAVMFKIVYEEPSPPSKVNPRLGPGHDYVVLHCLAKDRNKRYASAHELLGDLEDLQHGRPPRSQTSSPAEKLTSDEPTMRIGAAVAADQLAAPPKSKPKWPIAIVAAALVILGVVLGIELRSLRRPAARPAVVTTSPAKPPAAGAPPQVAPPAPAVSSSAQAGEAGKPATPPAPAVPPAREKETKAAAQKPGETKTPPPARKESLKQTPEAPIPAAVSSSKPAQTVATAANPPASITAVRRDQVVELMCRHDLKEGMLTVSSGRRIIWEGELKGRKRGGFLGIRGAYEGLLKRPVTIPGKADQLAVHVVAPDGIDLKGSIAAAPPSGPGATLRIAISAGQLTVGWQTSTGSTP